ncbi:hypothetical protein M885DRAFT_172372 [Pelagophyceae sp. CCMP2097]|nr:hypothetical protein M885DRAFT_172372 [Pelagophyceae sp. CCMP2097]
MLGFPAAAAVGAGVFSHVVQLSHTILPDAAIPISAPRTFDLLSDLGCTTGAAEQLVVRPAFARGSEVLAYADSLTVHSAPDVIHRDALWRFM